MKTKKRMNWKNEYLRLMHRYINPPAVLLDATTLDKDILEYLKEVKQPTKTGIKAIIRSYNNKTIEERNLWITANRTLDFT